MTITEPVRSKTPINQDSEDDDGCCTSKTTHFYEFKEYETLMKIINNLPSNIKDLRNKEKSSEQFLFICDTYQEQPHLIDPFLSEIFDKLIELVKSCIKKESTDETNDLINESFTYMHSLAKMRGYKKIVQYLPHEINDFEPVLKLLERQDMKNVYTWQTRFLLLLWLSIICMVPFDLDRFDAKGQTKNDTLMNRFLNVSIPYLFSTDKCQDASAFLLAKFMSRKDIQNTILPEFFERLFVFIDEAKKSDNNIKLLGTLKCIASIYKYGKREDLLRYTLPTLKHLTQQDLLSSQLALVRKFYIKIIQRVGTTFFKLKIAKWRYQRGSRTLMNNINKTNNLTNEINSNGTSNDDRKRGECDEDMEDNDDQVPSEIEEIIEQLLNGLKDKDTIVRWSSAKGIGRITNRLSKDMADDILQSLLDLFTFIEDDSAWHGGCLAIAELGRRGLLLPKQLNAVMPIILKALVFDKKLGNYSLGRNVRDSACYVCWSFARAFDPEVIKSYVNQLAGALLIVSVFDREVNCRRAASAAFQENVGRQGQFPHGIDILTKCDYYAVGQLHNCFLDLSVYIASFEEYRQQIIDHLLEHKFNHWDHTIRDLTAQTLFKLASTCPDYMAFNIIPKLLKYALSIDLNTRHGALLSLAHLIHSQCELVTNNNRLTQEEKQKELERLFHVEVMSELRAVISKIFDEKYFKGSGGEYMRPAVCFFIKKLSISKLLQQPSSNNQIYKLDDNFIKECETFLLQCIEYNKESIQIASVETIPFYCDLKFYKHNTNELTLNSAIEELKIVDLLIRNLKDTHKDYVRSGYCLALGHLPTFLLKINNNFNKVTETLISASKCNSGPMGSPIVNKPGKNETESGWVQARKDAIRALINLFGLIKHIDDLKLFNINDSTILEVFDCFLNGLNDYSIDAKGDSGSRVREASIEALETFTFLCGKIKLDTITNNSSLIEKIFAGIIQQSVERIDRTRSIAGKAFASILYNENLNLDQFPFVSQLKTVFPKKECDKIDWNLAYVTLPLFVKFLNSKEFQANLLTGIIYSIGSLTESVVKSSTSSFIKELKLIEKDDINNFKLIIDKLLNLCKQNLKSDRLSSSLIKAVDLVIQNGLLSNEILIDSDYPTEFLNVFLENVKMTKDMQRLVSYTDFFCDMLQFENKKLRERTMLQLMIMLCHQYPRIRKTAATKLFEALINIPDLFDNDDDNNECITLLTDTDWDQAVDIIRPIRNRICELTKTPKPVIKKVTPTPESK